MNLLHRSIIYFLVTTSAIAMCMENIKITHRNAKKPKTQDYNLLPGGVKRKLDLNDANQKFKADNPTDENQKWNTEDRTIEWLTGQLVLMNKKNK